MKLSDFIKNNAVLSGIKEDDAKLVTLLTATQTIDMDDALAAPMQSSFMTMDAAKNNPTLKSHFTAQALKTVDSNIEELMAKYEFPDEDSTEIKGIKSSYERIAKLTDKLAQLQEKKFKVPATDKDGKLKEKLENDLRDAKAEVVKTRTDYETKLAEKDKEWGGKLDGIKTDLAYENILAPLKYAMSNKLTPQEKVLMAKSVVNAKLNDLGVVLNLEDNKLIPKTKAGTAYYNAKSLSPSSEDLVKEILMEKGMLEVTPVTPRTQTKERTDTDNKVNWSSSGGPTARELAQQSLEQAGITI
jgi:hypothetical protein